MSHSQLKNEPSDTGPYSFVIKGWQQVDLYPEQPLHECRMAGTPLDVGLAAEGLSAE